MEVLTEEESRAVMESLRSPFTKQPLEQARALRPSSPEQDVLLIHAPGEPYRLSPKQRVPEQHSEQELLVKVVAIGLNPIDWKGPDYNFGLPSLPWINGRDLAGVVVRAHRNNRRVRIGDVILSPSTDYRDIRKAAFQEYVISTEFNAARVPTDMPLQASAAVGVAFVTAALALGVCLGVDFARFPDALNGPNLFGLVRKIDPGSFAADIRDEVLNGVEERERAAEGDWIAVWGGSSATGFIALQLAKLAKLRTVCVVDVARHGARLLQTGAVDLLVDRLDTERAVAVIRGVTGGRLRFAIDTVGRETAGHLQAALQADSFSSSSSSFSSALPSDQQKKAHLVGLTGLPKTPAENVVHHKVPIKAFHDVPPIGEALMTWLEKLLLARRLAAPPVETMIGGLSGVNQALDRLRDGSAGGKRLVVAMDAPAVAA